MKARKDGTTPPISALMKPIYVLQMNWWHWSDESRLKWLRILRKELQHTTKVVNMWIDQLAPK